jgi:glycosyltransferase involved in cell wall biosynthesis
MLRMPNHLKIVAPDIFAGDAVGNHCLSILRTARRLGLEAHAYAQRFSGEVCPIETLFGQMRASDTLLVSYSIHDPLLVRLLALPGRKLCYFHGVTTPELLQEFEPVTADLCARSYEQFPLLRQFDLLMANSHVTAQSLAPYMRTDDIRVIPPVAADMPIFQHVFTHRTEGAGLNLLVVGRVVPHKRIEDAIEILACVRASGVNARLRVVGDAPNGAYSAFLTQHAVALALQEHVNFDGKLDEQSLFRRFEEADALLSVSRHEGFCVPVLEAMHLGLPTFVRSGTAASEVGEGAAVEFDSLEAASAAICQMYEDREFRTCLVLAGKRRAADVLALADDTVFQNIFSAPAKSAGAPFSRRPHC